MVSRKRPPKGGRYNHDAIIKFTRVFADVDGMIERRSEPRTIRMARVEVLWEDEGGTPHISHGKLEDLSVGGLSMRIDESIRVGANLIVRSHLGNFPGTVLRCQQDEQDYSSFTAKWVVGMKFNKNRD